MELTIHWSPHNVQKVLGLMDMRADNTLLYENLDKFPGPTATIEEYRGRIIHMGHVPMMLDIDRLPPRHTECIYLLYRSTFLGLMFCEA